MKIQIQEALGRRVKVGRVPSRVKCGTGRRAGLGHAEPVPLGLNLVFGGLTGAATSCWFVGAGASGVRAGCRMKPVQLGFIGWFLLGLPFHNG